MSNNLERLGKITSIKESQKGTSQGGYEWTSKEFVIKEFGEYGKNICFRITNKEKIENFEKYNKVGDTVKVSFNVDSKEYNGRWFTNLTAWGVFKESSESNADSKDAPAPVSEKEDDLPF